MHLFEHPSRFVCALLLGSAFSVTAGCGTAAYEATLTKTLSEANRLTPFAALHDQPITIPDTDVSVRLPKLFDQNSASYAPGATSTRDSTPDGEKVVDPKRLHPSFLTIPDLKTTYEAYLPSGSTNIPVYCYLAVRPKPVPGPETAQAMEVGLASLLKAKFPDKEAKWEDVTATSPDLTADGGTKSIAWRKLAITANQEFDTGTPGSPQFYERNAQFELWLHDGEKEIVLIGWSVPELIGSTVNLPSLSPPVAGTVVIRAEQPADPAGA
jgi:hypothetical protein